MGVEQDIRLLASVLVDSGGNAVFFTGAGISTESGIPDFRSPQGLWTRISPEVFDIEFFYRSPDESWRMYVEHVYDVISAARPNAAHRAIAELEAMGLVRAVITQNIDRLHQKAGSRMVIELHGAYDEVECPSCGFRDKIDRYVERFRLEGKAPRCPQCNYLLKPAVVYFGEPLPQAELAESFSLARTCKVMVVVGTSLAVYPAALVPVEAYRSGAEIHIINLSPTPLDSVARTVIRRKAGEALATLVEYAKNMLAER